jgi:hypothetical protein
VTAPSWCEACAAWKNLTLVTDDSDTGKWCREHCESGPLASAPSAYNASFNVTSLETFEIREVASAPSVSSEGLVTESTHADHEVIDQEGDNNVAKILKGIIWILKKASRAVSIYSKSNNVKLAMEETKEAVEQATTTVEKMGSKLLRVLDYFMKTGPGALMQCIEDDNIDAFAEADFSDAVEEVESLVTELDELMGVSRSVVKIMNTVRGIAADTKEIMDGLIDLDLDSFLIPLEKHLSEAMLRVEGFLSNMKIQCVEAKESLERFLRYDLAKGKDYAKMKAEEIFGDLTPLIGDFNEIYTLVVKPLILELVKAIKAIYKAAKQLNIPLDAPESVADEIIDSASCSWRQTRWFKSIEDYNVDIEKTMVCDTVKTFGRWFKCRCVGTKDCYVPNKYRPGAKESRRCFQTA